MDADENVGVDVHENVDVDVDDMPVQISLSEFRIWIRARQKNGGLSAMAVAERFGLN